MTNSISPLENKEISPLKNKEISPLENKEISPLDCVELLTQISTKHKELDEFLFSHASIKKGSFKDLYKSMSQSDKMKYHQSLMSGTFIKDPKDILSKLKI